MKINGVILTALCCTIFSACETDDVDSSLGGPLATLATGAAAISEDGGSTDITVSLAENAESEITVNLAFGGTASGNGVDYNTSASSVTFAAGEVSKIITIASVQDTEEEGDETIEVSIESASGARFDAGAVTSILLEDDDVAQQIKLILNEILYDPSNSGLDGDANGDGHYDQEEDTFLEFVNLSTQPLDASGFEIYDTDNLIAGTPNHKVPAGTVIPGGKAFVVFGKVESSDPTAFGGAVVKSATTGNLNLNNDGDIMTLMDASGNVILTFDITPFSNNPNESYTRNPDLTGDFEQHSDNTALLFSPGTKIDGSPF